MDPKILDDLKGFDWQTIIDFGQSLDDLNDRQWRFIKGLVAELTVEKNAVNGLTYVGRDHCDYEWPAHGITVELKSQLSGPMYTKKGSLKSNFTIKLNNSNGTNKKSMLDPNEVADILLVVRNDGCFALEKSDVLSNAKKSGDGFEVHVSANQITEISGKITNKTKYQTNLKEKIENAIRQEIPGP